MPLLILLAAGVAGAHVPQLRGRLIDLVSRSDLIVVGTVEDTKRVGARLHSTTVRVETLLSGETKEATLTFRSHPRFAPGRRFVFFLHRAGTNLECIQASGTVFPAGREDDAAYRETIVAVRDALRAEEAARSAALRAALIPALSAPAPTLRYYAVLDFAALTHHGLTEPERRSLQRLVADPATDAAIRPILAGLLHRNN